ncbi:hypothetical protein JMN32_08650 [Fulvivirga sp. 29W222]|uniref:Uncharacterized protein n=1 Tax=Fulvivirga marina TaxID=2494733 RepID=A0A937KBP9_9BACT|nr:hypothetical protein [Fulvivirga marina]MBL6446374.1 hypothetical protein [Fulvivirga marina]
MENSKATWEDSHEKYSRLLEGLNELIKNTTRLATRYEDINVTFAHLIYENGLAETIEKSKMLKEYEREFQFMNYSLKGQAMRIKHLQELIRLIRIKDPLNCPDN